MRSFTLTNVERPSNPDGSAGFMDGIWNPGRLILVLLACLVPLPLLIAAEDDEELRLEQILIELESFDTIWTTIRDRHWDPTLGGIDWVAIRDELRPKVESAERLEDARYATAEMLLRLEQSHCGLVSPTTASRVREKRFRDRDGHEIWDTGCGFSVKIVEGTAVVERVRARSAAREQGLRRGWKLVSIAGEALGTCESTTAVTSRTLTACGESLRLGVIDKKGRNRELVLPLGASRSRDFRRLAGFAMEVRIEHAIVEEDVGYLSFNAFYDPMLVMPQFETAIRSFIGAEVKGVIIDLRDNRGGWRRIARTMAGWFFGEERLLATTRYRELTVETFIRPRSGAYRGPVALLVGPDSASTAEIFASCLQEHERARLFGARTAGMVQGSNVLALPNGASLIYPVSLGISPKGCILEGDGVAPDVEVDPERTKDTAKDQALQAAIRWIREEQQR